MPVPVDTRDFTASHCDDRPLTDLLFELAETLQLDVGQGDTDELAARWFARVSELQGRISRLHKEALAAPLDSAERLELAVMSARMALSFALCAKALQMIPPVYATGIDFASPRTQAVHRLGQFTASVERIWQNEFSAEHKVSAEGLLQVDCLLCVARATFKWATATRAQIEAQRFDPLVEVAISRMLDGPQQ